MLVKGKIFIIYILYPCYIWKTTVNLFGLEFICIYINFFVGCE